MFVRSRVSQIARLPIGQVLEEVPFCFGMDHIILICSTSKILLVDLRFKIYFPVRSKGAFWDLLRYVFVMLNISSGFWIILRFKMLWVTKHSQLSRVKCNWWSSIKSLDLRSTWTYWLLLKGVHSETLDYPWSVSYWRGQCNIILNMLGKQGLPLMKSLDI